MYGSTSSVSNVEALFFPVFLRFAQDLTVSILISTPGGISSASFLPPIMQASVNLLLSYSFTAALL
jgi:hypothetical protein